MIFNTTPGNGSGGGGGGNGINIDFIPIQLPSSNTQLTDMFNNKTSDGGNFKLTTITFQQYDYYADTGNTGIVSNITSAFKVNALNGHDILGTYDNFHNILGYSPTQYGRTGVWGMLSASQNVIHIALTGSPSILCPIFLRNGTPFPTDCIAFVAAAQNSSGTVSSLSSSVYAYASSMFPTSTPYGIFVCYK